jgi:hypothetical protein
MKSYNNYIIEPTEVADTLEVISEEGEVLVSSVCVAGTDQIILITEKPAGIKQVKKFLKVPESDEEKE